MQVGLLSKVSSTCKLIRMICQILSFQIGSHLVGVSLSKSLTLTFGAAQGIIIVKKSAFNNWSFHGFQLSVTIRVHLVSHTAQASLEQMNCVSSIQSCFSQGSVLVNPYRAGIALICGMNISILCFGLKCNAVKRIKPSGPVRIFMIRALIATELL